ncbi:30S ribosomal protein S17 [Salinisphaera hydrothermalis]|uniref:Small ribosomal subunit protein uS17 n=1 Tax=Salinisphaera hydrothermalis (strain C41B8) TaxID=1304275 RepID=A0A084IGQ9_SALHC|nr:30S ribosomal protein S17 [Salinisphaera hydrothermalis]KEZ75893.1 30S ribosomal protein S17 [Salinisphaera hydrothermalis C41B8]
MSDTNTQPEAGEKRQRALVGRVVSNAMDKTIVVSIERRMQHPLYGKYVKRSTKLKAHDADNVCNVGDWVEIREGRPISRHKSWSLSRVVDKAGEFDTAG